MLTDAEHRALSLTGELVNVVCQEVIGNNSDHPGKGDTAEFVWLIHGIQRMIMAQAAARIYPDQYRLLGHSLFPARDELLEPRNALHRAIFRPDPGLTGNAEGDQHALEADRAAAALIRDPNIPKHRRDRNCEYLARSEGCYWCCETCNYNNHRCPGCGDDIQHDDSNFDGSPHGCFTDEP